MTEKDLSIQTEKDVVRRLIADLVADFEIKTGTTISEISILREPMGNQTSRFAGIRMVATTEDGRTL